jgi:hypothetical protein
MQDDIQIISLNVIKTKLKLTTISLYSTFMIIIFNKASLFEIVGYEEGFCENRI